MDDEIIDDLTQKDSDGQKKKRGRKPKNKIEEVKVPKRRGRKPTGKIVDYTKILNMNDNNIEDDCIIAHLPISLNEIGEIDLQPKKITQKEKIIPDVFIDSVDSETIYKKSCDSCDRLKNTVDDLKYQIQELTNHNAAYLKNKKVYMMNVNFVDTNGDVVKWKENTDIACWWCCNTFENTPCSIPDRFHEDKFYVFGCFCSFNCAISYNIDLRDYRMWERCSLIHLLYKKIFGKDEIIKPAPPREALKMFGGPLSIEQFRTNSLNIYREYRIILPPMTSIVPLIEEDNRDKSTGNSSSDKQIPIGQSVILKTASENLKLKRSKPPVSQKNSLVRTMGLKMMIKNVDS